MCMAGEYKLATLTVITFIRIRLKQINIVNFLINKLQRNLSLTVENYHKSFKEENSIILSVIIPHVNYTQYLERCLDSVMRSSFNSLEVIVVESDSDDFHKVRLQEIKKKYSHIDNIRFIHNHRAKPGNNRNLGIKNSRGYFLCCIDPDDEVKQEYFEKAIFKMMNECLDIVGAGIEIRGQDKNYIYQPYSRVFYKQMLLTNRISGHSVFSKDIFNKAGGYLEQSLSDPHIHEDWYLWQRMLKLGARAGHIQEALTIVNLHGANLSKRKEVPSENWQINEISLLNSKVKRNREFATQRRELRSPLEELRSLASVLKASSIFKSELLVFLPFLDQSGVTAATIPVLEYLENLGIKVTIICTDALPDSLHPLSVKFCNFNLNSGFEFLDASRFVGYLLSSRNIDFVWIIGSIWMYNNLHLINPSQTKVIDSIFNVNSVHLDSSLKYMKSIDMTLFESESVKSRYLELGGQSETKVLPNTVDVSDHYPKLEKLNSVIQVAFVGRLAPEKDPVAFCRIVSKVIELGVPEEVRFVMYGSGSIHSQVQSYIERFSLPIKLIGHVDSMKSIWGNIDIHVLTSLNDGRPNSILEAMASGVPTVAYDVGAVAELFSDKESGFIVKRPNEDEMASKIYNLICNSSLREKFSLSAYNEAYKLHSRASSYPKIRAIFNTVDHEFSQKKHI